jgi:hypothetical protein
MHRLVRDNLEEVLAGCGADHPASQHLKECGECREDVAAMRKQSALLRQLRETGVVEPRGGFYARVMERIEAQSGSIWNLFFDSVFGRRLAVASLALALLLGVYMASTDPLEEPEIALGNEAVEMLPVPVVQGQFVALHDNAGVMLPGEPDEDFVLVNLVTYREQ